MAPSDGPAPPTPHAQKVKALAFYLPQYHPIPENDEWWGKGFTEWTNVTKARPLYPGHYQPHVPTDLGYYDLRDPEVREQQAELARSHGIHGFVYYHYWFQGRRLLNRPFDEVLASGSPDFPFALCWANEGWTRNWDGRSGHVLIPQSYSADDDLAHIRWLATAFADHRYIKIDGRPLMLIYRPSSLPDSRATTDRWRAEAQRLGFPDLYLCWVDGWTRPQEAPESYGFDATVGFVPYTREPYSTPIDAMRPHKVLDYVASYEAHLQRTPTGKHFPSVMVGWDNTARYPTGAMIFEGATPENYKRWLQKTVASVADVREEENYLFIVAWNEWAEGNHLEPDVRFGRGFLEATRSVLCGEPDELPATPAPSTDDRRLAGDSAVVKLAELVKQACGNRAGTVVTLSSRSTVGTLAELGDRITFTALHADPESVTQMKAAGLEASQCDLTDVAAVRRALDELGDVAGLLFLDLLEHLPQPRELLEGLSSWVREHGSPPLLVAAPNAAHFDRGLGLLMGDWQDSPSHPMTARTLERLLERSGWKVVARADAHAIESEAYDRNRLDRLPPEMVGALRVVSETYNPDWSVDRFVWALAASEPSEVSGAGTESPSGADQLDQRMRVEAYFGSLGLLADGADHRSQPYWKRAVSRAGRRSPRFGAAVRNARRRLG